MFLRILAIVYITLFFTLSVILYFTMEKSYSDYKMSRRAMSFALFLVSVLGVIRIIVKPYFENSYTDIFILSALCYVFTFLNYHSFLYMIETSRNTRSKILKYAVLASPSIMICIAFGNIYPHYMAEASVAAALICTIVNFILLTKCLREYDKFILLMNNYYGNYRNIRWVPYCLWATFVVACLTVFSFYFKGFVPIAGVGSLITYTFISMKLLNIAPANIHQARESISNNEIVAVETEQLHHEPIVQGLIHIAEPQAKETEAKAPAEDVPAKQLDLRLEKRYEKVKQLMEKWVETGNYTLPGINIKDVATQMGTNSNYLSTYINNILETSFANWLNTLRVEKSKEYLSSAEKLSMEECGMKVGYESLYNYSRWFKAITGMSPSEWKKRNQSK